MVRRLSDKHMHLSAFSTNATVWFYFFNYCLIARLDQPIYCSPMKLLIFVFLISHRTSSFHEQYPYQENLFHTALSDV